MHSTEPVLDSSVNLLNFKWLITLRWVAVVGQSLAVLFVTQLLGASLPLKSVSAVLATELVLNLIATRRATRLSEMSETELAAWIGIDLATFTTVLALTGGPSNPFSFFYVVHVAIASFTLRGRLTWTLVLLSTLSYGALFKWNIPLAVSTDWNVHLYGIWVAYGLVASCIVYFLQRARTTIRMRELELLEQRTLREQAERLSSLATLAAGAAHELANPLGTIAVVSKELANELSDGNHESALADITLVRGQVERCRKILTRMAHTAGVTPGESDQWIALSALFHQVVAELPERERIRLSYEGDCKDVLIRVPVEAVAQALRVLVDNALDAVLGAKLPIRLAARAVPELELTVSDEGTGIDEATLQRVFEPFFTTKPAGAGMGLGLYLARNVAMGLGGSLALHSTPGAGTQAVLQIPASRTRSK